MGRYRKKPVVIDAILWDGDNQREVVEFLGDDFSGWSAKGRVNIRRLEGGITVARPVWIIRGVEGEHYGCQPSIFEATYEPVDGDR